jgi:hypothetical protein
MNPDSMSSTFVSASLVTDVLLDARNDARAADRVDLVHSIDDLLRRTAPRGVFTLDEAAELLVALDMADAASTPSVLAAANRGRGSLSALHSGRGR